MNNRADVEIQKEQAYKQFYNQYDDNMAKRMENHMESVTFQEMEKVSKQDQIILANQREKEMRDKQKEEQERNTRKYQQMVTNQTIKQQMSFKDQMAQQEKNMKPIHVQTRLQ